MPPASRALPRRKMLTFGDTATFGTRRWFGGLVCVTGEGRWLEPWFAHHTASAGSGSPPFTNLLRLVARVSSSQSDTRPGRPKWRSCRLEMTRPRLAVSLHGNKHHAHSPPKCIPVVLMPLPPLDRTRSSPHSAGLYLSAGSRRDAWRLGTEDAEAWWHMAQREERYARKPAPAPANNKSDRIERNLLWGPSPTFTRQPCPAF